MASVMLGEVGLRFLSVLTDGEPTMRTSHEPREPPTHDFLAWTFFATLLPPVCIYNLYFGLFHSRL